MKTRLLFIGLAFIAITTMASAQKQEAGKRQQDSTCIRVIFLDENKNGICDNYENRGSNLSLSTDNKNCTGYRSGKKQFHGKCGRMQEKRTNRNFIDADKNGICDFRETPANK